MLLDTHAFLWAIAEEHRLSDKVRALLEVDDIVVRVSLVSLWEISIKAGLKQLEMPDDLLAFFRAQLAATGFEMLAIEPAHVVAVRDLPLHHRDPFDRLLIAQSGIERIPIVSNDRHFSRYAVDLMW